jgi:hypothetical protein
MKLLGIDIDLRGKLLDFCLANQENIAEVISHPEHFGNFVIRFTFGDVDLRILRDRGQLFVEAKNQKDKIWRDAEGYLADSENGFRDNQNLLAAIRSIALKGHLAEVPKANNQNST